MILLAFLIHPIYPETTTFQGFRGVLKSLKFSCIIFKALKSLKLYKKVLIMISRGLKFGDGKTRIAIMAECDD